MKFYPQKDDALTKMVSVELDRKSPEIARGTWARVMGTREKLKSFLDSNQQANVINCGAGFDSGFWYAV